MSSIIIFSEGGPYERGLNYGAASSSVIRQNLKSFWSNIEPLGLSRQLLFNRLKKNLYREILDEESYEYLRGMAEGAGTKIDDVIILNMLSHVTSPEECTVFIAMKDSTASGKTLFLKNSDKIGSEKFVGPNFYNNKELNVIIIEKPDDGYKFIAVAAAGEISIKMGINEMGVVAGSNIARTKELRERRIDVTQVRALDRGWLLREGITRGRDADAAAGLVLSKLAEKPMSTPGNIEFVDPSVAQLIEGSYDRLAVQKVTSGFAARSNRFVVLEELNDRSDVSSYARYVRATQLLEMNRGKITPAMLIEFSQDHENGPGPNSICRHSMNFRDETSLSAAVMEIDEKASPVIHVSLGKPCHAWKDRNGHVTLRMDSSPEELPAGFLNGETFKRYYSEVPVNIGA